MEKLGEPPRRWIVRFFECECLLVASETAKSEVVQNRVTASAFRDNMVQAKSIGKECLRRATVFASIIGAPRHNRVEPAKIWFTARHQMRDRLSVSTL